MHDVSTFDPFEAFEPFEFGDGVGAVLPGSILAGARILIDWAAAADLNWSRVGNANSAVVPTANLLAFSTGRIFNESGGATPNLTAFYSNAVDPSGGNMATRVLTTGTNQILYAYRATTCPLIPAGVYGLRFRCRAAAGTGPWTFTCGLSTDVQTKSAQDLDWTLPENEAATTIEAEFTFNGTTGDFYIMRPALSGADILIDRVQIYAGGLSAIPTWEAEKASLLGARPAFSYANSIANDGNDNFVVEAAKAGGWILEPGLDPHTYTEFTIIHVGGITDVDDGGYSNGIGAPVDAVLGTVRADLQLGWEATVADYSGWAWQTAENSNNVRGLLNLPLLDAGIHIHGFSHGADYRQAFFWEIPGPRMASTGFSHTFNRWFFGSSSNTIRTWINDMQAYGPHAATVIFDRALSNAEYARAVQELRTRLTGRNLATLTEFHVISGDSNATTATNDWTQLISEIGYMAPGAEVLAFNSSVGGQGTTELEGEDGRFLTIDAPALLAAAQYNGRALYHYLMGTNDAQEIIDNGTTAYLARVQAIIQDALDLHADVHVMYYTILPRTDADMISKGFEALRLIVNSAMRTYITATARVSLCDFGSNATIGDPAEAATYYLSDGIHLNSAGDVEAAALAKTAIAAWRMA